MEDHGFSSPSESRTINHVTDLFSKKPVIRFLNPNTKEKCGITEITIEYPILRKYARKDIVKPYLKEIYKYSVSIIKKDKKFQESGMKIGYFELKYVRFLTDDTVLICFGIKQEILDILKETKEGEMSK